MGGNEIVGKGFRVLDHGSVTLVDYMGSDADIVAAARTSYQKGTKTVSTDETLIRYLVRNSHTSPLECATLKFHVKLPIFVERQWARHRTASWNEVSARYSELPEEWYTPSYGNVRVQSSTNKQGSGEVVPDHVSRGVDYRIQSVNSHAFSSYHDMLYENVSRELARTILPVGVYTEKVWVSNLHNLLHFLRLRMDSHAQKEIRDYANIIGHEIVAHLFPMTWKAFLDYRLQSMTLSRLDQEVIRQFDGGRNERGVSEVLESVFSNRRERQECRDKLIRLGLISE